MITVSTLEALSLETSFATIGAFDGIHLGHQNIIRRMVEQARDHKTSTVVITFDPHPAVVLRGLKGAFLLTTPAERAELLANMGIDALVSLHFDAALAGLAPEEFMQRLKDHFGLQRLFVGYNFALGRGRSGDIPKLREIGEDMGYTVETIAPVTVDEEPVSSSRIRAMLAQGDVRHAALLLGRRYSLRGEIVHGDGRGHGLGIPTANLAVSPDRVLPALGVYATFARFEGRLIPSVTNIGFRPTFESGPTAARVEIHLLDFDQDLYGHSLELIFVQFLRGEQRFPSIEALLAQIHTDIHQAREVLQYG